MSNLKLHTHFIEFLLVHVLTSYHHMLGGDDSTSDFFHREVALRGLIYILDHN